MNTSGAATNDVDVGGGDGDGDGGGDAARMKRWKPKPLPSSFGGDGVERARGDGAIANDSTGKSSPFARTNASSGEGKGNGAAAASPFAGRGAGERASPFATNASGSGIKPAQRSPFGAAEARSPFDAAPASKSPFGGGGVKNPFNEPDAALYGSTPAKAAPREAKKVVEDKSVWESLPKPSLGQIFIVFSFVTIISLMLGTFWVVVNAGGVHFNDAPAVY